jgi:hypothetical protein
LSWVPNPKYGPLSGFLNLLAAYAPRQLPVLFHTGSAFRILPSEAFPLGELTNLSAVRPSCRYRFACRRPYTVLRYIHRRQPNRPPLQSLRPQRRTAQRLAETRKSTHRHQDQDNIAVVLVPDRGTPQLKSTPSAPEKASCCHETNAWVTGQQHWPGTESGAPPDRNQAENHSLRRFAGFFAEATPNSRHLSHDNLRCPSQVSKAQWSHAQLRPPRRERRCARRKTPVASVAGSRTPSTTRANPLPG